MRHQQIIGIGFIVYIILTNGLDCIGNVRFR